MRPLSRLLVFGLVTLVLGIGAASGAALSSAAVSPPLAGDTSTGEVFLLAGGTWHAISPTDFAAAGLSRQVIPWYDGHEFPGATGAPATAQQVADLSVSSTTVPKSSAVSPADVLLTLAGDTSTGHAFLLAGGTWHAISPADFAAAGLSQQAIAWYDGHEFPGAMGAPATAQQVAEFATSYTAALKVLGVTLRNPQVPIAAATVPATVKAIIAKAVPAPAKAVAGKSFVVRFLVTRSDTGGLLTSGSMSSAPSLNGKVIYPHWEKFQSGTATVRVTIPSLAKGKILKVPVTIKVGGASVTRVSSFRVS